MDCHFEQRISSKQIYNMLEYVNEKYAELKKSNHLALYNEGNSYALFFQEDGKNTLDKKISRFISTTEMYEVIYSLDTVLSELTNR